MTAYNDVVSNLVAFHQVGNLFPIHKQDLI